MKLIKVVEAYNMFLAIQNSNDIPIGLAWQIADHIAEMAPSFKRFEEKRLELAKKYGDADQDNADMIQIRKKEQPQFLKEFQELQDIEIEMNGLAKIDRRLILGGEIKVPAGINIGIMKEFVKDAEE